MEIITWETTLARKKERRTPQRTRTTEEQHLKEFQLLDSQH
jgi:hypothetical protein